MALLTLTRRLLRLKPKHQPHLLHRQTTHLRTVSFTFHRTLDIHSQTPHHFSTLYYFSTQTLNDPFQHVDPSTQTHDPPDPGLLSLLKRFTSFKSEAEAMEALDESGTKPSQDLVYSVIWALKDEWRLAVLAFKWGEKWGCISHDERVWNLMVWVLGSHSKFNTAWCLIKDLYQLKMDTKRAMLIMIDRYAAANHPSKAIWTFEIMEKFRMGPDEVAYRALLNALCRHGNIEEAEEFMLVNKKLFPLDTEGFNVILNGWCNISVDVYEAKRVWREMSKYCITPNAASYTLMISCFSKIGNLFDSLRLYDEMKRRSWAPGPEVYNSLIYVLTRKDCCKEALKMLDKMKENGLQPDSATYNSMIRPLCEAKKLEEAKKIFSTMLKENLSPTIDTYHAFLEGTGFEGTLGILSRMRMAGLGPCNDTFLLILGKFFKLKQPENALKIWVKMKQNAVVPSLTHYTLLIEGLATCGCLIKAREFYAEMVQNGFLDDPKLKKLLKEPLQGNEGNRKQHVVKDKGVKRANLWKGSSAKSRDSQKPRKKKISGGIHNGEALPQFPNPVHHVIAVQVLAVPAMHTHVHVGLDLNATDGVTILGHKITISCGEIGISFVEVEWERKRIEFPQNHQTSCF